MICDDRLPIIIHAGNLQAYVNDADLKKAYDGLMRKTQRDEIQWRLEKYDPVVFDAEEGWGVYSHAFYFDGVEETCRYAVEILETLERKTGERTIYYNLEIKRSSERLSFDYALEIAKAYALTFRRSVSAWRELPVLQFCELLISRLPPFEAAELLSVPEGKTYDEMEQRYYAERLNRYSQQGSLFDFHCFFLGDPQYV